MKTIITILFFLISFICNSQIVNYYDMKDGAGTTLTDHKGTAGGTLAGASLPTWNTGYLSFVGGHNTTGGDYNRVNITNTSYLYLWNESYSWIVIWRSSKADAAVHSIVKIRDINSAIAAYIGVHLGTDELVYNYTQTTSTQNKTGVTASALCDGFWHISVITYSTNSTIDYIDGALVTISPNNTISSSIFYTGTSKVVIGAAYASTAGNYQQDFAGDVCRFINCNSKITGATVQDIETDFTQLIY